MFIGLILKNLQFGTCLSISARCNTKNLLQDFRGMIYFVIQSSYTSLAVVSDSAQFSTAVSEPTDSR